MNLHDPVDLVLAWLIIAAGVSGLWALGALLADALAGE